MNKMCVECNQLIDELKGWQSIQAFYSCKWFEFPIERKRYYHNGCKK